MGVGGWLKAFDTVSSLVEVGRRLRGPSQQGSESMAAPTPPPAVFGQLEARLAGVVVAALKEAFDRDRARMDLERAQVEAEHHRAEQALRLELQRQAIDRAVQQLRLLAV